MSRLIDADEFINELSKHVIYNDDGEQEFDLKTKLSTDEVLWIITIDEQQTVTKWIPCGDKLPDEEYENKEKVFVQGKCEGYFIPIAVMYHPELKTFTDRFRKEVEVVAGKPFLEHFSDGNYNS